MKGFVQLLLFLLMATFVASCVPTKKYTALEQESLRNRRQKDSLRSIVDKSRHLQFDVQRLENQQKKDQQAFAELEERFLALSQNNQELLFQYNQLLAQNQDILSTSSSEKLDLTGQLAAKQTELDQKERALSRLEDDLRAREENIQLIREQLRTQQEQLNNVDGQFSNYEKQLQELQQALQRKDQTLLTLRQSVNQALLGFTDSDLTVSEKNGKIYVSLSQNLLFASGSDRIDWKGKKAIIQVAQVLKNNPDILVNVEGHTDAVGNSDSNWDLSVRRATAVVKVLTGQGVPPQRVTASGRALYDPIAPNDSAANKAKNRRTEIILTPKLDQLYEIINQ